MAFEDLKDLIGSTASICQIIQFFSGALVCKKFMKKGTSDDISPFPFICGFLSCALWTGYSKLLDDFILIYINVLGSLLMFSYCIAHYLFATKKNKTWKLIIAFMIIIIVQFHISSLPDIEEKKHHLGIICSILTVAFFAAPFANLTQVFRQKSSESMPFPIIITSFIVSLQWSIYGYLLKDPFVMYLNFAGFLLSFFQLTLFFIYPARWMKNQKQEVTILIPEHKIKISS